MKIATFEIECFEGFKDNPQATLVVPYTGIEEPILYITKKLSDNQEELKEIILKVIADMQGRV